MAIAQALISVSDKTGIIEFARGLNSLGIPIISSGGTAKAIAAEKIPCREISSVTGFPEILDGRVKTLNPKIHGGILARRDTPGHLKELDQHQIAPIDIVVVNLYPFEDTIAKLPAGSAANGVPQDVIENIDIGGVALLRAAGKNFNDVLVVCDPSDYAPVLEALKNKAVTPQMRRDLAAKAFRHTAYYDALISGYLTQEKFPAECAIPLKKISGLRYGENPHQAAALYRQGAPVQAPSVVSAKPLQGKELSYNNYLDLESAWRLVLEFDQPTCAIIKHNNPCGCAQAASLTDAYTRALACDTVSAFGGIIALNGTVDETLAGEIVKLFTECIIAPAYTDGAMKVFATKKNLRILVQPLPYKKEDFSGELEYRALTNGMLMQDKDNSLLTGVTPAAKRSATDEEKASLLFAWKICKHVKSNAIILARGTQAMGIGAGQMSRIDSLKIAIEKMKEVQADHATLSKPLVMASDAFFPFNDVVKAAAKIGVTAIIQPGGSMRDADSIQAADENNMAMLMTGMRHFRH